MTTLKNFKSSHKNLNFHSLLTGKTLLGPYSHIVNPAERWVPFSLGITCAFKSKWELASPHGPLCLQPTIAIYCESYAIVYYRRAEDGRIFSIHFSIQSGKMQGEQGWIRVLIKMRDIYFVEKYSY